MRRLARWVAAAVVVVVSLASGYVHAAAHHMVVLIQPEIRLGYVSSGWGLSDIFDLYSDFNAHTILPPCEVRGNLNVSYAHPCSLLKDRGFAHELVSMNGATGSAGSVDEGTKNRYEANPANAYLPPTDIDQCIGGPCHRLLSQKILSVIIFVVSVCFFVGGVGSIVLSTLWANGILARTTLLTAGIISTFAWLFFSGWWAFGSAGAFWRLSVGVLSRTWERFAL